MRTQSPGVGGSWRPWERRTQSRVPAVARVAVVAVAVAQGVAHAQTPVTVGYKDFNFGTTVIGTPTGEKPENKLWWNDGLWWGVLWSPTARTYRIHRFNPSTQSWADTGTALDNRANSKADALWDEGSSRLYVVSHVFNANAKTTSSSSSWGRLYRYSYDTTQKRYTLESGFPVNVTRGNSETLTIAKDSTQRLWVAFVQNGKVRVNWSGAHDLDWGVPVDLPFGSAAAVSTDDIASVVAFGAGRIGVMWSNELTKRVYFAVHVDVDPPGAWQPLETVLPGGDCVDLCADDHVNLATDSQGRVFAAVKTSNVRDPDPLAMLLVRDAAGAWAAHTVGEEQDDHTRPIVLVDEENELLYVIATAPDAGGQIYMKTSPLNQIAFPPGRGQLFLQSATDTRVNNASSTKQRVNGTTGLLVVASDQNSRYYFHNYLPPTGAPTPPSAPTDLVATPVSSGRVDLAWSDASPNENGFEVERATDTGTFSPIGGTLGPDVTAFSDLTVAASTQYHYRVRAINAAGPSAYSNTASVATPAPPPAAPAAPTDLVATPISGTQVDLTWADASSDETAFHLERAIGSGSFTALGSALPANTTSFADTTVSAGTTYHYRVRAENGGAFSSYSTTATADVPGGTGGVPIKSLTFEEGSLVAPVTGADVAIGGVTLDTVGALKGSFAAHVPNVGSAYLEERFEPTDDAYLSFYVRVNALPSGNPRLVLLSNGGVSVGTLILTPAGKLRLRVDSTTIGAESAALTVGQLYRVGIRQRRGAGANAVLEGYLATGDAAFEAPFAATAAGTWTTASDRLRIGATTSVSADVTIDDVRLDGGGMPGPSQ